MKLKYYDWCVFGFLAVAAFSGGFTVALLAAIAGLLYLIVRRYFSVSKTTGIAITPSALAESPPEMIEFFVHDSDKHDVVDRDTIELDVDINRRPAPGHFLLVTRFDRYRGKYEYEYKIDGTSVSLRVLNSYDDPSPANLEEEWKVRDGVVLESELRARDEAMKFKLGSMKFKLGSSILKSIDEDIASLKSQTEWQELTSWAFNGFKYFLLNRSLPALDARRYLRGELERLKLGIARATQEFAAYGVEPDPNPESIDGWRWIEGKKPEDAKIAEVVQPFWDKVKTGTFGITAEETGRDGRQLIVHLQKMLGE
jgi:hypothetical protein